MTAQIGDRLEIMGRQVHAGVHIPFVDGEHIERLKEPCSDVSRGLVSSTACSRGYRADWRLSEEALLLTRVQGFVRLRGATPVIAGWLTGDLVLPLADIGTFTEHWLRPSFCERVVVTLRAGKVQAMRELDWMEAIPLWIPETGIASAPSLLAAWR